jgi:hypothetical protein
MRRSVGPGAHREQLAVLQKQRGDSRFASRLGWVVESQLLVGAHHSNVDAARTREQPADQRVAVLHERGVDLHVLTVDACIAVLIGALADSRVESGDS